MAEGNAPAYWRIVAHYEACLERFGDCPRGVDWPNADDARTRYEVMLGVVRSGEEQPSLLDFGCGASHLREYLAETGRDGSVRYAGLDLSPRFVELSRQKFPEGEYYCLDLLRDAEKLPQFDYIVANGVFTERCSVPKPEMERYFRKMVAALFSKCRNGLAFNVMSTLVDWEREDLFHVSLDWMSAVLREHASRDFVVRQDYGLYEYTVYVYRREPREKG